MYMYTHTHTHTHIQQAQTQSLRQRRTEPMPEAAPPRELRTVTTLTRAAARVIRADTGVIVRLALF